MSRTALLPRLYREAPVNAIWEGSGNVMALDVLRAVRAPEARDVLAALAREAHGLPGSDAAVRAVSETLAAPDAEATARIAVERLARLAAAAALATTAPEVAAIFAPARLARPPGSTYGSAGLDAGAVSRLLGRAFPA